MTNPLAGKIAVRDVLYLCTVVVTVSGAYFGLSAKMDFMASRLDVMDDRLWQLQGSRSIAVAAPIPCPADATFVAVR